MPRVIGRGTRKVTDPDVTVRVSATQTFSPWTAPFISWTWHPSQPAAASVTFVVGGLVQ
jgi:hypothetical protein